MMRLVRCWGRSPRKSCARGRECASLSTPAEKARLVSGLRSGALRNYEEDAAKKGRRAACTRCRNRIRTSSAGAIAMGQGVQIRGLMLDVTEKKMFQSQLPARRERDFQPENPE